ncbi:MAG: EAL domain-containing protein [Pseudomonadota bacterium]
MLRRYSIRTQLLALAVALPLAALAARPALRVEPPATCDPAIAQARELNPYRANVTCERVPVFIEERYAPWDRWFENRIHPAADGISIFFHEITGRKRAEAERRGAEQRVQIALEAANASTWETDLPTRRVRLSDGWARTLGEEPVETQTTLAALMAIAHPDDVARIASASLRVVKGESELYHEDHRVRARNGAWLWIRSSGRVIERDAAGRALRMAGTNVDVTREKREESLLALEHAVTRVLADADTATAGLRAAIHAICQAEGWEAGRFFRADEPDGLLRFWASWSKPGEGYDAFEASSRRLTFAHGTGIAGRVWKSGEPIWVSDIGKDARIVNTALASESKIRSAFVFPVTSEGRTVGVLATFSREVREPDARLLAAIHVIGSQLGQFLRRKEAEKHLARHARRQAAVARFSQAALAASDPEALIGEAVRAAHDAGDGTTTLLELRPSGEFTVRAACGEFAQEIEGKSHPVSPDSIWPLLVESNTPVVVGREYLGSRPVDQSWRAWIQAMASAIYAPVRGEEKSWMLASYSPREQAFGEDDARHLMAIGATLSTALRRLAAEQRLAYLAQFDGMTGLPNRALFRDRLEQAIAQARRNQWLIGVLFVDLDQFKWVNDTLGHAAGDELLRQAGGRLQACLRSGDTVARLGGDEYAVVLPDLPAPEAAGVVAQKMLDAFKAPFVLNDHEVFAGASIGITVYPADAAEADVLTSNADIAMYRAKDAGRNCYQFFTPQMNAEAARKLALEKDLRRALERGEFELHYQPKAQASGEHVTGVEALLRWRRADGVLVSPVEFIPVLEETGLIAEVGDWVVRQACRQLVAWNGHLPGKLSVAVNVSARQFRGGRLLESVQRALAETGCAPGRLQIEITESTVMHDVALTVETLQALRALGVGVAVDDFGTGYSSLAYLKRLPVDIVKIDRSFVRDINEDPNDAAIASAVVAMGHALGYRIIAEGVETEAQRRFLAGIGCDEIQGYLLSRPLPPEELLRWLGSRA